MFRLLHMMALRAALLTVLADFKVLAVSEAQVPPRTLAIMLKKQLFFCKVLICVKDVLLLQAESLLPQFGDKKPN